MNEEIKKRIEQIKRGELPDGYARTRAGIMPKDWFPTKTASQVFKKHSDKKHNGKGEVLSATQNRGIVPRSDVDIDIKYAEESVLSYKKVESGDFVISLRSFQGGIEYSEYNGLVSPAYTVLKPVLPVADDFYKAYFKTADFVSRLNSSIYGIRDGKQIGFSDFGNMLLQYPPLSEQQKIAEILTTCDKLIALKKELIAEEEKLKKSCLSKMFPKQGSSVPEIRFPGFADAWEQRKLSEIADFGKGQGYTKSDLKEAGTPIILYGRLYTKYQTIIREVDTFADVISGAVLSNGGEVILPSSGETAEDIAIAASVDKSGILLGGGLNVILPHEEIESSFLAAEISFATPHTDLAKLAQGKSIVHLYNEDLKKVVISYPPIEEQAKISTMLDSIDHLITLHRRELVEMEKYKKALMQLLLTGIVRVS